MSRRQRVEARRSAAAPSLPTRVPELIRSLARWAVWSSMGAAAACGTSGGDADERSMSAPANEPDAGSFAVPSGSDAPWVAVEDCTDLDRPSYLDRVRLNTSADFVGIYEEYEPGLAPPGVDLSVGTRNLDRTGFMCTNASDFDACTARVTALLEPDALCMQNGVCVRFLLTTDADEVMRTSSRNALLEMLLPVDSPEAAVLVAMFAGFPTHCPDARKTETRDTPQGIEVRTEWDECSLGIYRQTLLVTPDGVLTEGAMEELGPSPCAIGRRPFGLCAATGSRSIGALGAFLAQNAHLEAASVYAFERLTRELVLLGAPEALIRAAARSAHDEIRHTLSMSTLARHWGGTPVPPRVAELPLRGAMAIALDNAVEGCVRETYGAIVAHHQARTARDPELRAAMRVIAADETRHAELSWRIASWLEPRLSPRERRQLDDARRAALAQLVHEVDQGLSPRERRTLGWPSPEVATRTITRFGQTLFGIPIAV